MKTHHQTTWQLAKLILAALVFAFGMVACGGGGGGGGTSAGITPSDYQLAITEFRISAVANAQQSGTGERVAQSAFAPAADEVGLVVSVTVKNSGGGESPATSFVLYRSGDATLESSDDNMGTYSVGTVAAGGTKVITATITTEMLSNDPASPTHFIVAGEFDGETLSSKDEAANKEVANDFLGVEVYSTDGGVTINNGDAIAGSDIVDDFDYDWSATGAAVSKATSVATGEKITLTFDVTNTIDFRAPRASLSFYRSTDATITTFDTGIGAASVGALAAGATFKVSTDVFAPSSLGTYYYGACVVSDDDSDSSNDCSTGVAVAVTVATEIRCVRNWERATPGARQSRCFAFRHKRQSTDASVGAQRSHAIVY